jgi:UDP-3-O-[3-hydroxymyristoyl] glucosamine N-acyltransferase
MAGNSSTGRFSVLGGGACITNKVHIGDFAQVGGMTGVTKDVPAGETSVGVPGRKVKDYFLLQALLNKMIKERKK